MSTTKKVTTKYNKRKRLIGKIYRLFEDDIWGKFIYKNLYFYERYQYLLSKNNLHQKKYSNMGKLWEIIKTKQFFFLSTKNLWDREKRNILRIDIINPKRTSRKFSYKLLASLDAKKFKYFYHNIPIKQLKKIIITYKNIYTNKYKMFLYLLESRLDMILYRLHFVQSIGEGRQYINHGKITVNNRIINKQNYIVKRGDVVSTVLNLRIFFQKNILYRLLPLRISEILYYQPIYLEINYRILSATVLQNIMFKFEESWVPFFSNIDPITGLVYYHYRNK